MIALIAALPLVLAVVLIVWAGKSALVTGVVGLVATMAITLIVPAFKLDLPGIAGALEGGLLTAGGVSYVLLGGVTLYHVMRTGNALTPIAAVVARAIPDRGVQVLALVFGVSVFFESATGFGVGIIVTAPLFMALGMDPIRAATLALIGQCAVPWGALAVGTVLGAQLSGVSAEVLGAMAIPLGLPYLFASGLMALRVAGVPIGNPRLLVWLVVHVTVLSTAIYLCNNWLSVELAGCLGGLAVIAVSLRRTTSSDDSQQGQPIGRALVPLMVLLVALGATRLSPAVQAFLTGLAEVEVLAHGFRFAPLAHPGFWLLVSAIVGAGVYGLGTDSLRDVSRSAIRQWLLATAAVASCICFGQVMVAAEMTTALAQALAAMARPSYALVVPVIGAIGGFLTASNAASNALFMSLQLEAGTSVGLSVESVAAAQNAAGSNLTLASPGRVVLAAAVAGEPGAESELIRRVLPLGLLGLAGTIAVIALGLG
jgi:lactate permease